jgi:hypothetical protein
MKKETLRDLIWKMECKGFDAYDVHIWISAIWCITAPLLIVGVAEREYYDKALKQAHVEIDFTNYKK